MNLFDKTCKIENLISSLFALEPRSKCKLLYILVVPAKCMQISGLVFNSFNSAGIKCALLEMPTLP